MKIEREGYESSVVPQEQSFTPLIPANYHANFDTEAER